MRRVAIGSYTVRKLLLSPLPRPAMAPRLFICRPSLNDTNFTSPMLPNTRPSLIRPLSLDTFPQGCLNVYTTLKRRSNTETSIGQLIVFDGKAAKGQIELRHGQKTSFALPTVMTGSRDFYFGLRIVFLSARWASFIHSCIHSFVYSFIHPFIHQPNTPLSESF